MLSKKQRVSRKLFETAYRASRTFSSPFFVLKVILVKESFAKGGANRFAFSVAHKITAAAPSEIGEQSNNFNGDAT